MPATSNVAVGASSVSPAVASSSVSPNCGPVASNGSSHWKIMNASSATVVVWAMSTPGPGSKSWKPPAYRLGSTPLRSRPAFAASVLSGATGEKVAA